MTQTPVEAVVENKTNEDEKTETRESRNKKSSPVKSVLRVVIMLVIIAVGIFLILFLVAKASRYDSILDMLQHMGDELSIMWQRITA